MILESILLSLISVLVGWFLAQFTSIVKDRLYVRKIAKALLEELAEIHSELERTQMALARQLQLHAHGCIDNSVAIPLANHIFSNYYKDAVLGLNKAQRISYQLIHTMVGQLNSELAEFRSVTEEIQDRVIKGGIAALHEKDSEMWGSRLKSLYLQVAKTKWHIKYHLTWSWSPSMKTMSQDHEEYLKYFEATQQEIEDIVTAAKDIPVDQLKATYNPEHFEQ